MVSTSYNRSLRYFNMDMMKNFPPASIHQKILDEIYDAEDNLATKWVEENIEMIKERIASYAGTGNDNCSIQVNTDYSTKVYMKVIDILKALLYDLGYQVTETNSPPNEPNVLVIWWRKSA